jgi:DNA primase
MAITTIVRTYSSRQQIADQIIGPQTFELTPCLEAQEFNIHYETNRVQDREALHSDFL